MDASAEVDAEIPPIDAPPLPQQEIDFLPPSEETISETNWVITAANVTIDTSVLTVSGALLPNGVSLTEGTQHDGATKAAILRVHDFKIEPNASVRVIGNRPLFILSGHDLLIEGVLDVSAAKAVPGPGGSAGAMGLGAGRRSTHYFGFFGGRYDDSGAGGGSFGGLGAAGGRAGGAPAGAAGQPYGIGSKLVGGASGGLAGNCTNPPGAGGGAVLLYGRNKIDIKGVVTAGGGGGAGGLDTGCAPGAGAGAGGGSGGTIWLQTPDLKGTGVLTANGGGGGGGSYSSGGSGNGGDGANGTANPMIAAAGGTKADHPEATAGGSGAIQGAEPSRVPDLSAGNGGGGGGGLGRIVFRAPVIDKIKSSPTAVAAP